MRKIIFLVFRLKKRKEVKYEDNYFWFRSSAVLAGVSTRFKFGEHWVTHWLSLRL
jgi:hypothetical protein